MFLHFICKLIFTVNIILIEITFIWRRYILILWLYHQLISINIIIIPNNIRKKFVIFLQRDEMSKKALKKQQKEVQKAAKKAERKAQSVSFCNKYLLRKIKFLH